MPPKVFDVVDMFFLLINALYENNKNGLNINELCDLTKMTKKELNPFLKRLEESDWVSIDNKTGFYYIGMRLLHFADSERLNFELVRQLAPTMKQLSKKCGQTVEMNTIESVHSVCIYKVEPNNAIRIASKVGRQSPLHAGASGKILLAYAPESLQKYVLSNNMKQYSPKTIIDPLKMMQELNKIRCSGYAESVEEHDHGAAAISVPILNNKNNILAEISIIGTRFDYEKQRNFWLEELLITIKNIPTYNTTDGR